MADTTDVLSLPFPEGSDANDVPADMEALATRLDEVPGVESLTSAEIASLAAGEKPEGRVVYNSTLARLQVSDGTSFYTFAPILGDMWVSSADLDMNSQKITGLGNGTTTGDAVARQQIQSGTVASAAGGYADVSFSPAFAAPPVVVATANASGTFGSPGYIYVASITTSGARIYGLSLTMGCEWIAVGN
jgi:hypothetical protein